MLYLQAAAGLILLFFGGEGLVRGATRTALRLGVSPVIVGLTLVGFGTSTPELVASIDAALVGAPAIALGNVAGSNIANVLLILGLTALVAPIPCRAGILRRDGAVMVAASAVFLVVGLYGAIGRPVGLAFLVALAAYLVYSYRSERADASGPEARLHRAEAKAVAPLDGSIWRPLGVAGVGLIGILLGANLLIEGAVGLARDLGLSERVIGLTLVAVGTSLPELAAGLIAAWRGQGELALGNVIGSNIFNILGILGATALIVPLPVEAALATHDLPLVLILAVALVVVATTGHRISRVEGFLLSCSYGVYLWVLF